MAVSTSVRRTEQERFWFQTRIADSTTMPLTQLKKTYWTSLTLGGTYREQEILWLKKLITDNGQTPSAGNRRSQLLREALSALAIVPSIRESENWSKLYTQYNP